MAKKTTYVGIDIGYDMLKLALISDGVIKKLACADMPENIVKEGRIVSIETMAELIRYTMKKHGIRCKDAAVVLSDEITFVRNVVMPKMSEDQLVINLPYEFRDYISEELRNYTFDYAMISSPEELKGEQEKSMSLTAACVKTEILDELRQMLRKAGLRLAKAAPVVMAYAPLLQHEGKEAITEHSVLDIGFKSIRLYIYKGDVYEVTREIELGIEDVERLIADLYSVDIHLAHTYLITNHEDCQNRQECRDAYTRIAVELMRAVNFYRFSNPDSQLNDLWLCGGGAAIDALREAIEASLDLTIHPATELVPGNVLDHKQDMMIPAIGIAMD